MRLICKDVVVLRLRLLLILTIAGCRTCLTNHTGSIEQLHGQDIIGYSLYTFKIYELSGGKNVWK